MSHLLVFPPQSAQMKQTIVWMRRIRISGSAGTLHKRGKLINGWGREVFALSSQKGEMSRVENTSETMVIIWYSENKSTVFFLHSHRYKYHC